MSSEYITASEGGASHHHRYLEISSSEPSADSSANPSRPTSASGNPPKNRGRVRFNSTSEANDATNQRSSFPLRDRSVSPHTIAQPKQTRTSPAHSRSSSDNTVVRHTPAQEQHNPFLDPVQSPVFKPRPSMLRNNSTVTAGLEDVDDYNEKAFSALAAQERAQRIASLVGSHSAPASRRTSLEEDVDEGYAPLKPAGTGGYPVRIDDIPLVDMDSRRTYDGAGLDSDEDDLEKNNKGKGKGSSTSEAHKLVRAHTRKHRSNGLRMSSELQPGLVSGQVTPTEEQIEGEYVPRPQQYRGGVLSSLLKLYNAPQGTRSRRGSDESTASPSHTGTGSLGSSGRNTPKSKAAKWYNHKTQSHDTLAGLIEASKILAAPGGARTPNKSGPSRLAMGKKTHSGKLIDSAMNRISARPRLEDEIRITVHIAETLSRQKYLLKLCRALISYGAPTHRLEEYMKMSARVLEIDGQFLYIPGCMIISFDDASTHTTEVKLVRVAQGVDLGKLKDIHEIYKEVVHDVIGVEEATQRLDAIIRHKQKHHAWLLVFVYGFASATVGPFGKSHPYAFVIQYCNYP
jgi:hypothetical protein